MVTAVAIAALVSWLGNRLIGLIEIRLGVLAALLRELFFDGSEFGRQLPGPALSPIWVPVAAANNLEQIAVVTVRASRRSP